jgi:transaldolase
MKIFLDSGITAEIEEVASLGIIDGATTNPSLIKASGRALKDVVLEIRKILPDGDISVEVLATEKDGMIKEAKEYLKWDKNFTIKIPMTLEGLKAVKELSMQAIKTNVTLVFSLSQAILAAKAGATYISPFLGRLDDITADGMNLIEEIRVVYDNYLFETEILAASIRHPEHVRRCALAGADVCTIPPQVLKQMLKHPLTDSGLEKFLKDAGN